MQFHLDHIKKVSYFWNNFSQLLQIIFHKNTTFYSRIPTPLVISVLKLLVEFRSVIWTMNVLNNHHGLHTVCKYTHHFRKFNPISQVKTQNLKLSNAADMGLSIQRRFSNIIVSLQQCIASYMEGRQV